MTEIKPDQLVKQYTFWLDWVKKKLYLIIDIPLTITGDVVIMQVKKYEPGEPRIFKHIPFSDWVIYTEEKKLLVPHTPKI